MSAETYNWLRNNVLAGFADKRGAAWHAINGTATKDDNGELTHYAGAIPVDDVLRRLFNFEILEAPIKYDAFVGGKEVTLESPDDKVIYRGDTGDMLGKFKNSFVIHPYNEWLIEKAANILDTSKSDLAIANAGLLANGAVGFVQYEVPDSIKTPEGVEFRPSMLSATSVNGTLSTTDAMVFTNVVCDNTMTMAFSEDFAKEHRFKVKHSKYSNAKLSDARAALGIYFEAADTFAEQVKVLCETKVTGLQFKTFINFVAPTTDKDGDELKPGRSLTLAQDKQDKLLTLWTADPRVAPWMGTGYGVLQMMNTYFHHEQGVNKGTIRAERNALDAISGKTQKNDIATLDLLNKVLVTV